MAKILFLHGLESRPGGVKPTFLASLGHEVLNPALPDDDFAEAVRIAEEEFREGQPDLIVGSSRGGAVAMAMSSTMRWAEPESAGVDAKAVETPQILIAPAWRFCGIEGRVRREVTILHAEKDEVIPLADSRELVQASGLGEWQLEVVGESHTMNDEAAQKALAAAVERWLT